MQALHDSKAVAQLEVLQTDSTFLATVEEIMRGAPLHSRNSPNLLRRKSLLTHLCLCEERAHTGLFAGIVSKLPAEVLLDGLQHPIFIIELILLLPLGVLLAVPIVNLAAFRLRVGIRLLFKGMGRVGEGVSRDCEAEVIEDGDVEGDELLKGGLVQV